MQRLVVAIAISGMQVRHLLRLGAAMTAGPFYDVGSGTGSATGTAVRADRLAASSFGA
jgi:hypothetical protein